MFFDARRKIDRADKHIGDAETAILALERDYVASIEVDRQAGQQSIKYECPDFNGRLIDIALIAGDAIHNLRTALDYAWIATIETLKLPVTKWTKFPFADSSQALNNTLLERKIDRTSPALFKMIMTEIEPYRGGDPYLWGLHDADITDKHKLVLPVIEYSIPGDISIEDERGTIYIGSCRLRRGGQGVIFVDFPLDIEIKNKGKISVSVFFHEGSSLAGVPILEELPSLSSSTFNVIKSLERLSSRTT